MEELARWQDEVRDRKLKKKQEKKDERTIHLMEQAKPLSDAFIRWHEQTVMKESRYLIYRRTGRKKFDAFCTHCGGHVEMPAAACKNAEPGRCPSCGSRVTMKSSGMTKNLVDTCWTEYVQAVKEGLMIRFVRMTKDYTVYGAPRRIVEEPCRVVIEKGKPAVWYERRDSHTEIPSMSAYQKNRKEGCIHGYNFPMPVEFGAVYGRGLERELKKAFPYNMFRPWLERKGGEIKQYTVYDYFDTYSRYPLLESLEKTGKTKIVDEVVEYELSLKKLDGRAETVSELLGITRQQYRELKNPAMQEVQMCRLMRERGIELDARTLGMMKKCILEHDIESGKLDPVLEHKAFRKFIKYMERQEKRQIRNYYLDYLAMGRRLGYDYSDSFVLFPKNPKQAHDAASLAMEEKREEEEREKRDRMDKSIMKTERKIRKRFSFEDEEYLIRPAKTSREIIREGQIQHICVGSAGYAGRMAEGRSYILFLRKKAEPEKPFYTVEITPDYEIIQRHGKYNQEHEEVTDVDRFLKKFVEVKKNGKKHYADK